MKGTSGVLSETGSRPALLRRRQATLFRRTMRFNMPPHRRHHDSVAPLCDAGIFHFAICVIMQTHRVQCEGARGIRGAPEEAIGVRLGEFGCGFRLHMESQPVDPAVLSDRLGEGGGGELAAIDREVLKGEGPDQIALIVALARLRRPERKR